MSAMQTQAEHEEAAIKAFVLRGRQERFLSFLSIPRNRKKFTKELPIFAGLVEDLRPQFRVCSGGRLRCAVPLDGALLKALMSSREILHVHSEQSAQVVAALVAERQAQQRVGIVNGDSGPPNCRNQAISLGVQFLATVRCIRKAP